MDFGWVIQAIIYLNIFLVGIILTLAIGQWRAHRNSKDKPIDVNVLPDNVREEMIDTARKHYQRAVYKSAVELDKNLTETTSRLNQSLTSLRESVAMGETEQYNETLNAIRNHAANIVGATLEEISAHQKELRTHFEEHQASLDRELEKEAKVTEQQLRQYREEYQKRQAALEAQLAEHQKSLEQALAKREEALTQSESQLEAKMIEMQKGYAEQQQQMEVKLQAEIEARRQQLAGKLETELADTLLAFLSDALGSDVDLGAQTASLTKLLEEHKEDLLKGVKQ